MAALLDAVPLLAPAVARAEPVVGLLLSKPWFRAAAAASHAAAQRARSPSGLRKVLYVNWALVVLLVAVCAVGFLMLFSVAGGSTTSCTVPSSVV